MNKTLTQAEIAKNIMKVFNNNCIIKYLDNGNILVFLKTMDNTNSVRIFINRNSEIYRIDNIKNS